MVSQMSCGKQVFTDEENIDKMDDLNFFVGSDSFVLEGAIDQEDMLGGHFSPISSWTDLRHTFDSGIVDFEEMIHAHSISPSSDKTAIAGSCHAEYTQANAVFETATSTSFAPDAVNRKQVHSTVASASTIDANLMTRVSVVKTFEEKVKEMMRLQRQVQEKEQQSDRDQKRPITEMEAISAANTTHNKPSAFLRAALQNQQQQQQRCFMRRPFKRLKPSEPTKEEFSQQPSPEQISPLHLACLRSDLTVQELDQLLRRYPTDATKSVTLYSNRKVWNASTQTMETRLLKEKYTVPLHLAIHHCVSHDVIEMLMTAAPSVLMALDGPLRETPLSVLLKKQPDSNLVAALLLQNPKCARVKDRHDNTALHVACSHYGVSKEVLKQLLCMDPRGLLRRNFHGKTPLQLLQERIAMFDDEMSVFLMQHNEQV